jgi:hypothetical protein
MKKFLAVIFVFGLTMNMAYSAEPSLWHRIRVWHAKRVEAKKIEKLMPKQTSCTPNKYIDKNCRPIKQIIKK